MIISPVSYNANIKRTNFSQNSRFDKLSGLEQLREFNEKLNTSKSLSEQKEQNLIDVLYNSVFALNSAGKYNSAKIIYDDLRERTDLDDDYLLDKEAGDLNKKTGDIQSANTFYKKAFVSAPDYEFAFRLDTLKNFGETNVLLDKGIPASVEELAKVDEPFQNMVYFYLQSLHKSLNGENSRPANEIDAAYKIMTDNKITDDAIIFQQAFSLSATGEYEKSNSILNERLESLNNAKQVYTKEFLDYLILLGLNKVKEDETPNYPEALAIFKNASQIAEITQNIPAKEVAQYAILKVLFSTKDERFSLLAKDFIDETNNPKLIINLSIMLGDFVAGTNPQNAKSHYSLAIEQLKKNDDSEKLLFELYEKLKTVSPQDSEMIDVEISKLNVAGLYTTKFLQKELFNAYKNEDTAKVEKIADKVINSGESNEQNKSISKIYLGFANIKNGKDMNDSLNMIDDNIKILAAKINNNPDKKEIKKCLYYAYQYKADILYNAMKYYEAAESANKSDHYFDEENHTTSEKARQKIVTTLYNYKAKRYNDAERYALNYLSVLLNKEKIPSTPLRIKKEANETVKAMNDTEKRKLASAYETLGLINLKNKNFADSREYFLCAVDIRERLKDRDFQLANSYAALARIAILTGWKNRNTLSSKDMHTKSLEILKRKHPNSPVTLEEEAFHKKYYGVSMTSAGKWLPNTNSSKDRMIAKFRCYNKELSICE